MSVLITTRRRDGFLAQALDSLLHQTWSDWEAVVVDNGFSEETRAVVGGYNDTRLLYIPAPANLGECGGRNRALEFATGSLVCYLDDDDLLPPSSLKERVDFMEAHPECGMIYAEYSRLEQVDGGWQRYREARGLPPYLRKQYYDGVLRRARHDQQLTLYLLKQFNFVRGGTPLIRRDALDDVGHFDEELNLFGDYDLWLRLTSRHPIRFLDEVVYVYRVHRGSISVRMDGTEVASESALRVCQKNAITKSLQFERYNAGKNRPGREYEGHVALEKQSSLLALKN